MRIQGGPNLLCPVKLGSLHRALAGPDSAGLELYCISYLGILNTKPNNSKQKLRLQNYYSCVTQVQQDKTDWVAMYKRKSTLAGDAEGLMCHGCCNMIFMLCDTGVERELYCNQESTLNNKQYSDTRHQCSIINNIINYFQTSSAYSIRYRDMSNMVL